MPAEPETPAPPSRRAAKPGLIAAALLVATVLVGSIVFISRGKNVSPPAAVTPERPAPQTPRETAPAPTPPRASKSTGASKKAVVAGGEVVHRVIPEVSQRSRNTITGIVKVAVRVEVDSSGKVTAAKLASPGPSKYFAGLALKAAKGWEFSPPQVDGQPTASTWALQFHFRRSSVDSSSERVTH